MTRYLPAVLLCCAFPLTARADGGTVRLMEVAGDWRITAFTSPTPLVAGPIDVSVMVQNAETGEVLTPGPQVQVTALPLERRGPPLTAPAISEAATNKLLQAAHLELPYEGKWQFTIEVTRPDQSAARLRFDAEAAPLPPRWFTLWPWFCWPAGAILLYALHRQFTKPRRGSG